MIIITLSPFKKMSFTQTDLELGLVLEFFHMFTQEIM